MTSANVSTLSLRKFFSLSFVAAAAFAVFATPQVASAQSRVSGAAISKVARDTRKLTISASVGTSANGTIQFIHNSPAGLTRFRGQVSCVSVSGGTVHVTGTIDKGETHCLVGEPTCPNEMGEMMKIGRRGSVNMWIDVPGHQGHRVHGEHHAVPGGLERRAGEHPAVLRARRDRARRGVVARPVGPAVLRSGGRRCGRARATRRAARCAA